MRFQMLDDDMMAPEVILMCTIHHFHISFRESNRCQTRIQRCLGFPRVPRPVKPIACFCSCQIMPHGGQKLGCCPFPGGSSKKRPQWLAHEPAVLQHGDAISSCGIDRPDKLISGCKEFFTLQPHEFQCRPHPILLDVIPSQPAGLTWTRPIPAPLSFLPANPINSDVTGRDHRRNPRILLIDQVRSSAGWMELRGTCNFSCWVI